MICSFYWQEILHERVKTYKGWKEAEATLTKKRENKAKLELAHKTDKISQAEHEITDVSIFLLTLYRIVPKFSDTRKLCYNLPKIQRKRQNLLVFCQKDANHHHHHHIRFRARFPLPRVGLFDKSSSKTSSPLRVILRVSRVHI